MKYFTDLLKRMSDNFSSDFKWCIQNMDPHTKTYSEHKLEKETESCKQLQDTAEYGTLTYRIQSVLSVIKR